MGWPHPYTAAMQSGAPSTTTPDQPTASIGAPAPAKPAPSTDGMVITAGFILIGGVVALMLLVALRFLRRAADPETHGYGQRRPTKGFEKGRGRDPWREAGRRLQVPPVRPTDDGAGGSDGPKDGDDDDDDDGGEPGRRGPAPRQPGGALPE